MIGITFPITINIEEINNSTNIHKIQVLWEVPQLCIVPKQHFHAFVHTQPSTLAPPSLPCSPLPMDILHGMQHRWHPALQQKIHTSILMRFDIRCNIYIYINQCETIYKPLGICNCFFFLYYHFAIKNSEKQVMRING